MMSRGRPPKGPELVEGIEGSELAKLRLKVILQTVAGEITVADACTQLNVSEARFHELRSDVLRTAAQALEPKPAGRPAKEVPKEADEVARLKKEIQELKIDLRAAQIREELSLLMPHVLKPRKTGDDPKKK
jgi:HAMP domain-containing protein